MNIKPKSIFDRSAIDFAIDRSDPEILKLLLTSNVAENSLNAALNRASSSHDSMRSQESARIRISCLQNQQFISGK